MSRKLGAEHPAYEFNVRCRSKADGDNANFMQTACASANHISWRRV